jgi:recombination protein RecA
MNPSVLRRQIEAELPSAFAVYKRNDRGCIPTGISQIDREIQGVPLHALTEICGSNYASSGKTSVLLSLLAHASREYFCALVDAGDCFDPTSAHAAEIKTEKLLWIRCGKTKTGLGRLEQAFKVTDILLQSGGFGLIAVDLSGLSEKRVRSVPMSSWFRFSRVIEKQSAALVFIEQEPHATSCAGLVLRATAQSGPFSGNLFTGYDLKVEVIRGREKRPVRSEKPAFSLQTQWA